jgi:hypothetical protein
MYTLKETELFEIFEESTNSIGEKPSKDQEPIKKHIHENRLEKLSHW